MSEHATFGEREITCPYCKAAVSDSWEYDANNLEAHGEMECWACDKKFKWNRDCTIDYSSVGICEANGLEHKWYRSKPHRSGYGDNKWIGGQHCNLCGECELLPVNQKTGEYLDNQNKEQER